MDTARAEVDYIQDYPDAYITATTTVEARTLDLTDQQVLDRIGVAEDALMKDPDRISNAYEQTQQIGDIAKNLGYEAIIYPSFKTGGKANL